MANRDTFWRELPLDSDNEVLWPENQAERDKLACDVFGASVIGAPEAVLEERFAIVNGEPPRPGRADYEAEVARCATFGAMSELQRAEVRRELKKACFGTLYWILVKLDHYPSGDVDFTVTPFRGDVELPPCSIRDVELSSRYFDCVQRFSKHGEDT